MTDDGHEGSDVAASIDEEALERLLELQETDTRIRRLDHKLENLEEQQRLEDAHEKAGKIEERQAERRVELDELEAKQRKIEGEIDLLTQRKDAEHARMYSGDISNPKELQSLRAEIDSTEKRIEQQEEQLLEVMERVDELESELDRLETAETQLSVDIDELTDARDEGAKGFLAEKAELEVQREKIRDDIPAGLLERYDAKAADHAGMAAAQLEHGMCTGCRIELPMVDRQELFEGPPLGECPNCGRLLVII